MATQEPNRRESNEPTRYFRLGDIARMLDLSLAKVSHMSNNGEIPGRVTFGRSVRFERSVIEAWLATKK